MAQVIEIPPQVMQGPIYPTKISAIAADDLVMLGARPSAAKRADVHWDTLPQDCEICVSSFPSQLFYNLASKHHCQSVACRILTH